MKTACAGARRLVDGVLSVVWAPCCAVCDAVLERPTCGVVCPDCWRRVQRLTPPLCYTCGLPRAAAPVAETCAACDHPGAGAAPIARRRAAGWYQGSLRAIIQAFKYGERRSLAEPLATLMRAAGAPLLEATDLVVPVPLHPRRRRSRGFNQARDLALRLGPPVADLLRRTRPTPPQAKLTGNRRRTNVRGAFALSGRARAGRLFPLAGRTVIVADDVLTTGATLDACAEVLRAAGARAVFGLTAARVAPRPRR